MKIITGFKVTILLALGMLVLMSCSQPDSGSDTLGRVWTRVLDNNDIGMVDENTTQFPKREGFGAVVFNGKMWVIGGGTGVFKPKPEDLFNDVWSSEDGVKWTRVLENDPGASRFSPRSSLGAVVFDNKIWVIGGKTASSTDPLLNDVWSSVDGVNWVKSPAANHFTGRFSFGILAFDGSMWVMGGIQNDGTDLNDVWSSKDGETWEQKTNSPGATPFTPRNSLAISQFKGKMWITTGRDSAKPLNDVWSSDNGVNWDNVVPLDKSITQANNNDAAHFAIRTYAQLVAFGDTLYLVGGENFNDVWSTSDGKTWTRILDVSRGLELNHPNRFVERSIFSVLEYKNKIWLMGGITIGDRPTELLNDVWVSE